MNSSRYDSRLNCAYGPELNSPGLFSLFFRRPQEEFNDAQIRAMILGAIIVAVFYYLGRSLSHVVRHWLQRQQRRHISSIGMLFGRLAHISISAFGFLTALSVVIPSFKAGDLINFLGVGGVAVGFAFRDVLQNFFAGIFLIFSRATTVRTNEGQRIIVPNALLLSREVRLNHAYGALRSEVEVPLRLTDDLMKARELVAEVVQKHPLVSASPGPVVSIDRFTAQCAFLKASWWTPLKKVDTAQVKQDIIHQLQARLVRDQFSLAPLEAPIPVPPTTSE